MFSEQLQYFSSLALVPSRHWLELSPGQHNLAFTIPGLGEAELRQVHALMFEAIASGQTVRQFILAISASGSAASSADAGNLTDWCHRYFNHYLRQSYNAGRMAQLNRLRKVLPYWRYQAGDSSHSQWNGLVLRAENAWWDTHAPANGWGCRCYLDALSERDLQKLGGRVSDTPPVVWAEVQVDGFTCVTPEGVAPGFCYSPRGFT